MTTKRLHFKSMQKIAADIFLSSRSHAKVACFASIYVASFFKQMQRFKAVYQCSFYEWRLGSHYHIYVFFFIYIFWEMHWFTISSCCGHRVLFFFIWMLYISSIQSGMNRCRIHFVGCIIACPDLFHR